ncbi:MAG: carboxypeptidase-like regulatory domain-containing protein, partial [Paramuribaculum sp.]|nr:carboxypeptidase-like regulatory domain-containing protein [Paramuribaculum sp.]
MKLRFKLLALLMLLTSMAASAGNAIVRGTVVDSATGSPVSGATVMLLNQALEAVTDASGNFIISDANAGSEVLLVAAFGYRDYDADIIIEAGKTLDLGKIRLGDTTGANSFMADQEDMLFDQSALEDNDGNALTIGALTEHEGVTPPS